MEVSRLALVIMIAAGSGTAGSRPETWGQSDQERLLVVEGTLVDERGQPDVDGAVMLLRDEAGRGSGGTYALIPTDRGGRFRAEEMLWPLQPTKLYLFTTSHVVAGPIYLMVPPFPNDLRHLGDRFAGIPIPTTDGARVNLGNVRARLRYGQAILRLVGKDRRNLALSLRFSSLSVRVSDAAGRIAGEYTFLASAVNPEDSTLWFGLPEGEWRFDIRLDGGESSPANERAMQVRADTKAEATMVFGGE